MYINTINNQNTKTEPQYGSSYFKRTAQGTGTNIIQSPGTENIDNLSFFAYDKNSMVTDRKDSGQNNQEQSGQSMEEFINNAIETLKNLVDADDYSKMAELGIVADKDDLGTIVTVYERIQIQLAAYGDGDISGLNISSEKIDKVLKSPAVANSLKMAEEIEDIEDEAKEYLLKNNMEPTVENIYKAVHSNDRSAGHEDKPELSEEQWSQLKPQVEKFLEKSGMEISKENSNAAKWLLDRDISLTMDNLNNYIKLEEIEDKSERDMESVKSNMVIAGLFGMNPSDGYMTSGWIDRDKAEKAVSILDKADESTLAYIVKNDLTLNVANLEKYSNISNEDSDKYSGGTDISKASRVLLEAKAVMTMDGAMLMEKLGIDITYTDLEDIVEIIKEENNTFVGCFFESPDSEKTDMLSQVMNIMGKMPQIPVAAIGAVKKENQTFSVEKIYNEGTRLREAFEKAGQTYEAVGTEVRPDLGDSMVKAFGTIDSLIEDTGLEPNDDTRRAARILGYNSMEITKDSLIEIAEKAEEVDRVIKNITPKTAAYLIENGINPLDTDIQTLNEELESINSEIGASETEAYSKYLWKLEKSGKVTKDERQAYIELYRTLKTISKTDARAIGAVSQKGAELTLGNLLVAEQSRAKYGMDVEVDSDTGYYQGRLVKNKLQNILENITSKEAAATTDTTLGQLEQMYLNPENVMSSRDINGKYDAAVMEENLKQMRETANVRLTEEMMYCVMDGKLPATVENMAAAAVLLSKGSEIRQMMKDKLQAGKKLFDSFNSEKEALEAYKELDGEAEKLYEEAASEGDKEYFKYRSLDSAMRFMTKSAENKSYNIPVDIDGDEVLVKVKFLRENSEAGSKIEISINDESTGSIDAGFNVGDYTISGVIVCGSEAMRQTIDENIEVFSEALDMKGNIIVASGESVRAESGEADLNTKYHGDKELYEISKTFLKALKVWAEMPIN